MRHLFLLLLPAALLAQDINTEPVTGTTTLVIRGSGAQESTPLTTWQTPLIWRSTDGKVFTQGPSGHLIPYHAPITTNKPHKWTYAAYGAAVTADYLSTRYALSHGATEALYRCNPHRAGCMNNTAFWTVAAVPVTMWLLNDLWLHKRASPRWQRFANFGRKLVIGARFGVAVYNVSIATGVKE